MIIPEIQKEELIDGYIERFLKINAFGRGRLIYYLNNKFPIVERSRYFCITQHIAAALDLRHQDLIRLHSIIPIVHGINKQDRMLDFGNINTSTSIRGLAETGRYIKCCEACIAEDRHNLGFTYVRRVHQFPGFDFCHIHGIPFISNEALHHRKLLPLEEQISFPVDYELDHPYIIKYRTLIMALRSRKSPLPATRVKDIIKNQVIEMECRVSKGGAQPLLSDFILKAFPESWLTKLLPQMKDKKVGEWHWLDTNALKRNGKHNIIMNFIVLSAIFENTQDCIATLCATIKITKEGVFKDELLATIEASANQRLNDAWVNAKGNLKIMTEILGSNQNSLAQSNLMVGLPSLGTYSPSTLSAFRSFHEGKSLEEASLMWSVNIKTLERLLRQSTKRPALLLKKFHWQFMS